MSASGNPTLIPGFEDIIKHIRQQEDQIKKLENIIKNCGENYKKLYQDHVDLQEVESLLQPFENTETFRMKVEEMKKENQHLKVLYEAQQQETDIEHQRCLETAEKYSDKLCEVCQELDIDNDDTSENIIEEIKKLKEENDFLDTYEKQEAKDQIKKLEEENKKLKEGGVMIDISAMMNDPDYEGFDFESEIKKQKQVYHSNKKMFFEVQEENKKLKEENKKLKEENEDLDKELDQDYQDMTKNRDKLQEENKKLEEQINQQAKWFAAINILAGCDEDDPAVNSVSDLVAKHKKIEKIVRESKAEDIFDKCLPIWYGEDEETDEEEGPNWCENCEKQFDLCYTVNNASPELRKRYEEYMGSEEDHGDLCPECIGECR